MVEFNTEDTVDKRYVLVGYIPVNKGKLRGFASVSLPHANLVLNSIRHIDINGRERLEPSCKFSKEDGYPSRVFEFGSLMDYENFTRSVLKQIHEYLRVSQGVDINGNRKESGQAE